MRRQPTRLRSDDDDGDGYSAVSSNGKDLIYCGDVGPKLAAFLWEHILKGGAKLGGEATTREGRRLFLNSCGGSVYDMLSIVDLFEEAYDLTTVATGYCMSAAVPIVASGTPGKRYATWRTRFMVHPMRDTSLSTELEPLRSEMVEFEAVDKSYCDILARYCHHTRKWWEAKLRASSPWYFCAKEALIHGIIDHIVPDRLRGGGR